jgi:hypothetical protein
MAHAEKVFSPFLFSTTQEVSLSHPGPVLPRKTGAESAFHFSFLQLFTSLDHILGAIDILARPCDSMLSKLSCGSDGVNKAPKMEHDHFQWIGNADEK